MYFLSFTSMKKTFFAGLLLMAAVQSANAQKVVLHMADNKTFECNVSQLDSITFEDDGFIVVEEHEWIDLGLPSGTLWATCNVGANSPEEYGDYFAWGETKPKDKYNEDTYTFMDNPSELLSENDAATANWGANWQMPTVEQMKELYDNCTQVWTQQNGVYGILVTGPNGNTIFLPAAGARWRDGLEYEGNSGAYWSSSISTIYGGGAYHLYFASFYWDWGNDYRDSGDSVRPVRAKMR